MAAAWTECTKNCQIFLVWWNPGAIRGFAIFAGVFRESGVQKMAFGWTKCGETAGKDGFRNAVFLPSKILQIFQIYLRGGIYTFVTIQFDQKALDWRA